MAESKQKIVYDRERATLAMDAPVTSVRLVSPSRAKALAKMGIGTVRDLVSNYPRRYVDMSQVATIAGARIGDSCTIKAQVHEVKVKRPRRTVLTEVTLVDSTGTLIVTAFRQPWLAEQLRAGMTVAVSGVVEFNYGFKRMTNPHIEALEDESGFFGLIIPVHPLTGAIKAGMMRRLVSNALDEVRGAIDPLPLQLRVKYRLMSRQTALSCIHFPRSMEEQRQARRRLAYEEVLLLELMLMRQGLERSEGQQPVSHVIDGPCRQALARAVPFELTDEQVAARDDILARMAADRAANHMLLGDVGTGKTIVAAFALAAAADTGSQALFMAPTEILARQHANSLGPLLEQAGISWGILTGSTAPDEREQLLAAAADGSLTVLFGTHALLEDDVRLARCTLAIIDEQQRFGVDQRAALLAKGACPDALFLTATPIPRTLALALFGNLTLSYIKQRPRSSAPRQTFVHTLTDRGVAYDAALDALARGEQVYVVCPLVGEKNANVAGGAGKKATASIDAQSAQASGGAGDNGGGRKGAASVDGRATKAGQSAGEEVSVATWPERAADASATQFAEDAGNSNAGNNLNTDAAVGRHLSADAAGGGHLTPDAVGGRQLSADAAGSSAGSRGGKRAQARAASEEDEYEFASIAIEDERDMVGANATAAEAEAAFLQAKVFVDYRVGLVHGKLPAVEKQQVMDEFRRGDIGVLVATTVIEVGVDVPNATVMIVEDADRFGLSQLHQLRGRVGRGEKPAQMHLVSGTKSPVALERLAAMQRTDDGFELASYDLSLRREGDILGNRQHGASLLKLVNIVRDARLVEAAHDDAQAILEEDPMLESSQYQPLAREARVVYRQAEDLIGG